MTSTVFIVDDDAAMRDSLWQLLDTEDLPAETFASAAEFLSAYDPPRPGCIVADIRMPGMTGLELLRRLRASRIDTPVILITAHGDVPLAVAALKSGADDFFEKPLDNNTLLQAINELLRRTQVSVEDRLQLVDLQARFATLTEREREVLDEAVEGHPNKLIAEHLGTSPRTIEVHRSRILGKMRARNLSDLIRMTLRLKGQYTPT